MSEHRREKFDYDVIVIGAGPGGLSAAKAAREHLMEAARTESAARTRSMARVALVERDEVPGGILNQCVHDGFGIVRYGAQLSGPEYGEIETRKAEEAGVKILTGCMVTDIRPVDGGARVTIIDRQGRESLFARSIVLATGCRERTRGMISVPGTRPAGIYTAGAAQNLINCRNLMVGRRVVILGSGDIGLIMARRLTLEGAEVLCVAEAMPQPSGLARNVQQCLFDYDIPMYLNTTVSRVIGKDRLEAVELARADEQLARAGDRRDPRGQGRTGELQAGEIRRLDCDTLILSVGLIPENEVALTAGAALDPKSNGVLTDAYLQSSVPGIFACGNARAVMDLADFVSMQGEVAGYNAAAYALDQEPAIMGTSQPLRKWEENLHNAARKGLPEEGSVICTLCPKGCQIRVRTASENRDDQKGQQWIITGNACPRGETFARQEMTDPRRILTTTMLVRREMTGSEELLPVRSDQPVLLSEMRELARQLREIRLEMPPEGIRKGDVLVHDLGKNRVCIVSERSFE